MWGIIEHMFEELVEAVDDLEEALEGREVDEVVPRWDRLRTQITLLTDALEAQERDARRREPARSGDGATSPAGGAGRVADGARGGRYSA